MNRYLSDCDFQGQPQVAENPHAEESLTDNVEKIANIGSTRKSHQNRRSLSSHAYLDQTAVPMGIICCAEITNSHWVSGIFLLKDKAQYGDQN